MQFWKKFPKARPSKDYMRMDAGWISAMRLAVGLRLALKWDGVLDDKVGKCNTASPLIIRQGIGGVLRTTCRPFDPVPSPPVRRPSMRVRTMSL